MSMVQVISPFSPPYFGQDSFFVISLLHSISPFKQVNLEHSWFDSLRIFSVHV
jgi:hypothetical protein